MLARRLEAVTKWLSQQSQTAPLHRGYFGVSTGAATTLGAAAKFGAKIGAVVSRGGRHVRHFRMLHAPTLLIVGSEDHGVIELNQAAYALLRGGKQLTLVPGATHLFEEPSTLEVMARLASEWFLKHLTNARQEEKVS